MVPEIAGPLARVLLRYAGGAVMAYAGIKFDVADPDLATLAEFSLGALLSVGAEIWWYLARKYNWCQ
jgi:hypothetical protein